VEEFDPFDVDVGLADARLAPGRAAMRLPDEWKAWAEPRPSLPIDRSVRTLIERQRSPMLRSPEALIEYHRLGNCPYAVARSEVSRAALEAVICVDNHQHRRKGTAAMMRSVKAIRGLQSQIAAIVNDLMLIAETQDYELDRALENIPLAHNAENLAMVWSALADMEKPLARSYVQRSQDNANLWRVCFAGSLFSTWRCLTGREPSTSGEFIGFLDAAWESLSDRELPSITWESAIKTARKWSPKGGNELPPWRIAAEIIERPPVLKG
jgi:hypothetical protein